MSKNDLSVDHILHSPTQLDLAFAPIVPANKLDADQYMAEDLDGVHQTLTGSGNLNFLAMQASQTNEAMLNTTAAESSDYETFADNNYVPMGAAALPVTDAALNFANPVLTSDAFDQTSSLGSNAMLLNNTPLSSNSVSQFGFDGANGINGTSPEVFNGGRGANGFNGVDAQPVTGTNGNNGTDGAPGTPGTGTTIINVEGDTLTEIINNVTNITNTTTTNITEIINNITDIDIIEQILGPNDNPDHDLGLGIDLTGPLGGILNPILEPVLNTELNQLLNPVEDIIGDLDLHLGGGLDLFGNNPTDNNAGDSDLHAILDGDLLSNDLIQTNLSVALDAVEQLTGDIDLDILGAINILGPFADPLIDNFIGGSGGPLGEVGEGLSQIAAPIVEPLLGDTNIDLGGNIDLFDPTNINNANGDTDLIADLDLTAIGIPVDPIHLDVPLDVVEAITGDIDLNLNVVGDIANNVEGLNDLLGGLTGNNPNDTDLTSNNHISLLGMELPNLDLPLQLNPVEDLVGDLDIRNDFNLALGDNSNTLNSGGDSDVNLTTNIDLIDDNILDAAGNQLNLDIVEQITGDIDLNLGIAGDLLGSTAAPLFDSAAGGTGSGLLHDVGVGLNNLGDTLLFGNSGADTDVSSGSTIAVAGIALPVLDLNVPLNPVEDLVGDLDAKNNLNLNLFDNRGTLNSGGDTDLKIVTDVGLIDHIVAHSISENTNLDIVEQLTGDIDLNLDVSYNALGHIAAPLVDDAAGGTGSGLLHDVGQQLSDAGSHLLFGGAPADTDLSSGNHIIIGGFELPTLDLNVPLNPVEDLVGDIDIRGNNNLEFWNHTDISNANGDSDLNLTTHIDVVDNFIADAGVNQTNLDIVEKLVGDIDIDLGAATNVLGDVAAPLVDGAAGGNNGVLADLGHGLSDIVSSNVDPVFAQLSPTFNDITVNMDNIVNQATSLLTTVSENVSSGTGFNPLSVLNSQSVNDVISWPESVLPSGSLTPVHDVVNAVTKVLPDPIGDITGGLSSVLDHSHAHTPITKFGGLFG